MGRETFIELRADGIFKVSENDGWSMNRGMQREEEKITPEELKRRWLGHTSCG